MGGGKNRNSIISPNRSALPHRRLLEREGVRLKYPLQNARRTDYPGGSNGSWWVGIRVGNKITTNQPEQCRRSPTNDRPCPTFNASKCALCSKAALVISQECITFGAAGRNTRRFTTSITRRHRWYNYLVFNQHYNHCRAETWLLIHHLVPGPASQP